MCKERRDLGGGEIKERCGIWWWRWRSFGGKKGGSGRLGKRVGEENGKQGEGGEGVYRKKKKSAF